MTDAVQGVAGQPRQAGWSSSRLYEEGLAHPLRALTVVALSVIVIVHFLAYIVLGAIALSALRASRVRR